MARHDLRNYACGKPGQDAGESRPDRGETHLPTHKGLVFVRRALDQVSQQRSRLLGLNRFEILEPTTAQIRLVHLPMFVEFFSVLKEGKSRVPPEAVCNLFVG
jgi:hypothetical protein